MELIKDVLIDTSIDSLKILPFLFLTYLLMEYIEHKTNKKLENTIKKSGKFGPIIGSILGIIPQCGFSVSATNLFAGRVISMGTLISIYLSTSDEMIPILISEKAKISVILAVILIKVTIGMISGIIIDLILNRRNKQEPSKIDEFCKQEHCHCEHGILKPAIKHTIEIFIFIFVFSLILNLIIGLIGEDKISAIMLNKPILAPIIACLIGLIPNCASSVILTELFVSGVIKLSTMIAGLLVNSGLGIIVLFKLNKNIKENLKILGIIYAIGVLSGIILELFI